MINKKYKQYYSSDKATLRWVGVVNFIIIFFSIAIISATLIFYWLKQESSKDVIPKVETDLMVLEGIENRLDLIEYKINTSQN